jgi:hypothetical protein
MQNTSRRVVISQYDGLYCRLKFEEKHHNSPSPVFREWHKAQANAIAHEDRLEAYVSNWIQLGQVSATIADFTRDHMYR